MGWRNERQVLPVLQILLPHRGSRCDRGRPVVVHSLNKGKRFERDVAKWLRSVGFEEARRTAQVDGGLSADVLADGLHVECKRYKRIVAADFMRQAIEDHVEGDIPIVVMRENGGETLVMLRADDLKDFSSLWLTRTS